MIYQYPDFPRDQILTAGLVPRPQQRPTKARSRQYLAITSAFDIETTTVELGRRPPDKKHPEGVPELQAFMYVWMYHFSLQQTGEQITVIGHYWQEWIELLQWISDRLPEDVYLVTYVHNLSFEWQYIRSWYPFTSEEIFAVRSRKILKCDMFDHIELRCSYIHSNLSLDAYTRKWRVEHQKQSGEIYDYSKIRYPWTPATEYETKYQVNDVIGLCEALDAEMSFDGDNLHTIPLTSTGYVRRIVKGRMHKDFPRYKLIRMLPDVHIMMMLVEAFRGGDTHANRYYVGEICENVESWDFSSSYPAWILNRQFPMGKWEWIRPGSVFATWDYISQLIYMRKRAILARVRFMGLRLKSKIWGCPYLTRDKGRNIVLDPDTPAWSCYDNGRILQAALYEGTFTDIDLRIIIEEYEFDTAEILDCVHARYDYLPDPIRQTVREFYTNKTELKKPDPTDEEELLYSKYKNLTNAIYGMCVESPIKKELEYDPATENLFDPEDISIEELLNKSNKRAFLSYAWGVWITAWARYELHRGLWTIGPEYFIYCDTDSVKFFDPDGSRKKILQQHNQDLRKDSIKNGGTARDPAGKLHYLGIFEREHAYKKFVTFGAKKYAYTYEDDKVHITISGVNKKKGAAELQRAGGIEALQEGFIFKEGGGTQSIYNDQMEPIMYEAEGRQIPIASNVVITDSEYTFGLSSDYEKLLNNLDIWLDITDKLVYH